MGQTASRRCRLCGMKLNPKKKKDMEQGVCSKCRKKGAKALVGNKSVARRFLFGGKGKKKSKKVKAKG